MTKEQLLEAMDKIKTEVKEYNEKKGYEAVTLPDEYYNLLEEYMSKYW